MEEIEGTITCGRIVGDEVVGRAVHEGNALTAVTLDQVVTYQVDPRG